MGSAAGGSPGAEPGALSWMQPGRASPDPSWKGLSQITAATLTPGKLSGLE